MAHPSAPDPAALRRRVLLTGAVTLSLFVAIAYVVASAGLSDWWLLVAMVVVYGLVIRPMMQPVRDASKLRRSLAFQAFLDSKKDKQ
jgi:fatty acid desaturase